MVVQKKIAITNQMCTVHIGRYIGRLKDIGVVIGPIPAVHKTCDLCH